MSQPILAMYIVLITGITLANFIFWIRFKKEQKERSQQREQYVEKF